MEFPELGKNCSSPTCKQLDFLPFSCSHCNLVFCKDHYLPHNHECVKKNGSEKQESAEYFKCNEEGCNSSSPVSMLCPVCQQHFCLSHRHHGCLDKAPTEDEIRRWQAPREQFAVAKNKVDLQLSNKLKHASGKSASTALKIQLMRLKGRAKGPAGIPEANRVYFLVFSPVSVKQANQAIYVSRDWTVGRVIDAFAEICKIPNRNNCAIAPKLILFRHKNGEMVGEGMQQKFQDLLETGLINEGENLILEYDSNDNIENGKLMKPDLYKV